MRPVEAALALLVALAFAPAALALAGAWSSVEYHSHGFFVPMVSLWLFARRGHGPGLAGRPRDARGLAAIAAALVLYAAGALLGSVGLQGLALVAATGGGALYLGGAAALRRHAFALAFLLFMVPLPPQWVNPFILQLQLGVSVTAEGLLGAAGFAIVREGNVLTLPGGESLFVAEACSGITSIVTLTPLAVLLAHLTETRWGRRAAIVAAVVPVAMLGNLLRVLATVVAAEAWGAERVTENALHDAAGVVTFALACLGLIGLAMLLARNAREPQPR